MPTHNNLKEIRLAVTGGTSGLGLALVRSLVARGARVAFVARTARAVEQIANETGAYGIVGDIGRKADTHPIALQVIGNLGGLDALINNASALGPTPLALLADTECEELEQALSVNLLGPFRLTKALFGALAASARNGRGAVVINISSDAAVNPYSGWGAYAASKAALAALARSLSAELAPRRIRVNCVAPTWREAPAEAKPIAAQKPAPATDAAQTVLFLASEESAGLTGQELVVGQ